VSTPDLPDLPEITRIASAAEAEDGAAPLDEATWMELRSRPERVRHVVADGGFALLTGSLVSLAVAPDVRRRGVGGRLLGELLEGVSTSSTNGDRSTNGGGSTDGELEAWSHADHPGARVLAERSGFERARELWVMRRPTSEPLPDLEVPEGVTIRGYRDEDAEALLAVNAAAFADHPEQGAMDADNLAERMAEPWFDPAGLLIAESTDGAGAGEVLGFHWTKQHDDTTGEVYVVGVSPAAQGSGLGRVLTLAGLHHLTGLGVGEILLYVESDNAPAVRVYRDKLGFTHASADTHVMYRRSGD